MGKSMKTDDENIVPTLNEIKANLTKDIDASIIVLIRSIKHIDEVELFHVPMTEGLAQGRLRTRQQL
jgi:hypothetical protein